MSDPSASSSPSFFGRLFARARCTLRDMAARHALRQELLECDRNGALDSILADLQMDRGEIEPMIGNFPLSQRLLDAMAARLRVDPSCGGPLMKRALEHTCAICAEQRRCRHWLGAGHTEGYEEFCPNADYWRALKTRIRLATMLH